MCSKKLLSLAIGGIILLCLLHHGDAFALPPGCRAAISSEGPNTALAMGKSRKSRRMEKEKVGKKRAKQFYDAIQEASDDNSKKSVPPDEEDGSGKSKTDDEREAKAEQARKRMEERPDVSTIIVDEDTGMEVVAQGSSVMDVVTRKAVKLSGLGPEYRLAQMFPGVPPPIREAHRFDWKVAIVPEMVEALREACSVKLDDGSVGIPPHPSVANTGIDFVLANRDYLGHKMKRTLGRLTMRSMWKGNVDEGRAYQKLWKNFLTLENHISAPFRQMILDAEGRVGPNFGSLDVSSFCDGELYERIANYLVLKGMVAHWEKKVKDAEYVEKTPQTQENFMSVLGVGDPKRYLPDPPILFTLRECTQVCVRAQEMCKKFVETEDLFSDFPPEIRFLETALTIKGGTLLRKYMIEEFCPAEGITPEGLREGMRRLHQQLLNMQIDPYGDLTNIVDRLIGAMSVGTDDERDPYQVYLANPDPEGPGYFQTYTFNHRQLSVVRFLDAQYDRIGKAELPSAQSLFNFGFQDQPPTSSGGANGDDREDMYKVPNERACGRPHELGWLDLLKTEEETMRMDKMPPGSIIPE